MGNKAFTKGTTMTTTATDTRWTVEVEGTFNPVTVRAGDAGRLCWQPCTGSSLGSRWGSPRRRMVVRGPFRCVTGRTLSVCQVLRVEVSPFGFGEPSSVWSPAKVWDF